MRILVLLFVLAAFAGCVGDEPTTQEAPEMVEETTVAEQFNATFDWALDAGVGGQVSLYANPLSGGPRGGEWTVEENATHLHVTSQWSCMSGPACSMALVIYRNDEFVEAVEGMSPIEYAVDNPGDGNYAFLMWADARGSVVVDATGSADVVVKYGATEMADEHEHS